MTCEGCSGAVQKVLTKLKGMYKINPNRLLLTVNLSFYCIGNGVEDFNISLESQKVTVKSTLSADEILEVIKKTGKEVQYIASS